MVSIVKKMLYCLLPRSCWLKNNCVCVWASMAKKRDDSKKTETYAHDRTHHKLTIHKFINERVWMRLLYKWMRILFFLVVVVFEGRKEYTTIYIYIKIYITSFFCKFSLLHASIVLFCVDLRLFHSPSFSSSFHFPLCCSRDELLTK